MTELPISAESAATAARNLAVPVVSRSYSHTSNQTAETEESVYSPNKHAQKKNVGLRRRLLGLALLAGVVILWTASGFLQSSIFADSTYSKPYFLTYFDTGCFVIPFLPFALTSLARKNPKARQWLDKHTSPSEDTSVAYRRLDNENPHESNHLNRWGSAAPILQTSQYGETNLPKHLDGTSSPTYGQDDDVESSNDLTLISESNSTDASQPLTIRETFFLSMKFAPLWYIANYFNSACLHYTTVSSVTILSSTSSVFTLIFGAISGVERFNVKKLVGVVACVAGVVLTSGVDMSGGDNEESRGKFPLKTSKELAIGDALALAAAILYGLYSVLLVKSVGDETRIRMPIFFGFLGLFNLICLWPGFFILDWLNIEKFSLPPNGHIWFIIVINAASSLISDLCWAYATLYTSPLIVTIGLSLTIPLSLVGQIFLEDEHASAIYWLGAGIVVLSFIFINYEAHEDKDQAEVHTGPEGDHR